MSKYFKEVSAIVASGPVTSGPPDQQALQRVDEKYGIVVVGPPLKGRSKLKDQSGNDVLQRKDDDRDERLEQTDH